MPTKSRERSSIALLLAPNLWSSRLSVSHSPRRPRRRVGGHQSKSGRRHTGSRIDLLVPSRLEAKLEDECKRTLMPVKLVFSYRFYIRIIFLTQNQ